MTAISSTSIRASWMSLPEYARHGTITGYKLFYRQKDSVNNLVMEPVDGAATLTKDFANLTKYTRYEFQVLAVGSRGKGPKSSVMVGQTLEDGKRLKLNNVGCKKHFFQKKTRSLAFFNETGTYCTCISCQVYCNDIIHDIVRVKLL